MKAQNVEYHVLNGDSLKDQFPSNIVGEKIVARECLVDGNVDGRDLNEFFRNRAAFIAKAYGGNYSTGDYFRDSVSEFEKLRNLPEESVINLWFEDDLFCQVNFWFVVYLIHDCIENPEIYLIRPVSLDRFGFGGLNETELLQRYQDRTRLDHISDIAALWKCYQENQTDKLLQATALLEQDYPFIHRAALAHRERIATDDSPGRPALVLQEIMDTLGSDDFGAVFREFNKREYIYGFGDLQVKRLFDQIRDKG